MAREITVEESSGNIFVHLGYLNAEEALAKSRLAQHIASLIKRRNLTQVKAAALLGIDQPKISRLLRGQLREFSTERLFRFLNSLNQDVEIVIKSRHRKKKSPAIRVKVA